MNSQTVRTSWFVLALLVLAAALAACGDQVTNNVADNGSGSGATPPGSSAFCVSADPFYDTDGDGLSNCDELNLYHTSPLLADTDGDGLSDFEEIVELGFHPDHNNYRFNPLIADTPRIDIQLVSPPSVELLFAEGTADETTVGTSRSSSSSSTVSTSQTKSSSVTVEHGVTAGFDGKELKAEYSYNHAQTTENSFTWSNEQTTENSVAWDQARTASQTLEFSGGSIATAVTITNRGNLSFTVTNALLGAVVAKAGGGGVMEPLGNLTLDSGGGGFTPFTLGPGQSTGALTFVNRDLSLAQTRRVLLDSSGLVVDVAAYEVEDSNGISYNHSLTQVRAKTALVTIDYGGKDGRNIEEGLVATNVDPVTLEVSLGHVLHDVLRVPYTKDGNGLTGVRGVQANAGTGAFWVVVHITEQQGVESTTVYDGRTTPYDLDAIPLIAGDVLQMVYLEDADHDGLGLRDEQIFHTDPNLADTDGDGLSDGFEVRTGWTEGYAGQQVYSSPTAVDTDGDTLTDPEELAKHTDPTTSDTDQDSYPDATDSDPLKPQTTLKALVAVDAGDFHNLAIDESGHLWAWGYSVTGALGDNCAEECDAPTLVGTDTDWVAVSAGNDFSLALKADGTVWSWGANDHGQLGDGTTNAHPTPAPVCAVGASAPCTLGAGNVLTNVKAISAGGYHALARIGGGVTPDTGWLYAWGDNTYGQLGIGDLGTTQSTTPLLVEDASVDSWRAVAAGEYHSTANRFHHVDDQGRDVLYIYSWGRNDSGQVSGGNPAVSVYAAPVQDGTAPILSAGSSFSLAVNRFARLYGSGSNADGRLGIGWQQAETCSNPMQEETSIPRWLATIGSGWFGVSAGSQHALGLQDDGLGVGTGYLYSFGSDSYGQLGRPVQAYATSSCVLPTLFGLKTIRRTWNDNYVPVKVNPNPGWIAVSAGRRHSLALKASANGNLLFAWGDNTFGQLGDGTTDGPRDTPVLIR